MSGTTTLIATVEKLQNALEKLENVIEQRAEEEQEQSDANFAMQRMNADRARLAQELDKSEHRGVRLEDANKEVSRRLVTAMETIRAVLDR